MAFWGKKKEKETETREERKKPGLIRRLWRKFRAIDWKNPVNRWKLLFASLVAMIVVFGGGYGVIAFTNSPTFCHSCHEMAPEYATYTNSAHNQISCVQCHIKPGMTNMLTHKVKSLKEVYYHVTGIPEQIVQTDDEAISNENCLQCHSQNRLVTASGDLKVNHDDTSRKASRVSPVTLESRTQKLPAVKSIPKKTAAFGQHNLLQK